MPCGNCDKSKRKCIPAGFQLFWPSESDKRRFIIPNVKQAASTRTKPIQHHFLNVEKRHFETRLDALSFGAAFITARILAPTPSRLTFLPSSLASVQDGSQNLSYFYLVVSRTLPNLGGTVEPFRDLLMKLALTDDSVSSQAVLFSVLSLSSLHYRQDGRSVEFKASTLKALAQCAATGNFTSGQILQHVAAGVLLARVEMALLTDATTLWPLFVCGVKTLLTSVWEKNQLHLTQDLKLLYKYVQYHSLMSNFSLRHWRKPRSVDRSYRVRFKGHEHEFLCAKSLSIPALQCYISPEVQLLTEVVDVVLLPEQLGIHSSEYRDALNDLGRRIREAYDGATEETVNLCAPEVVERKIFIAAIWIYFFRTAQRLAGPSVITQKLLTDTLDDPSTGIEALATCNIPFALFVLGCEAETDARRKVVLDCISRSARAALPGVKSDPVHASPQRAGEILDLLEDIWALDDIRADRDSGQYLDYGQKLHSVFTSYELLPALA